jgi:carbon monoxide dehydrogenase subunit G
VQLENSFTVPVPIEEAWRVLLDIERIAPCMPGAALDSVTGDDFTGRVKVKLGPINLTYQGKASFVEKDEAEHKAVIDARGKDQRGNGTAAAVVTAQLRPEGANTRVDVVTDLNITGRPAQFGRGVMTDVGNKLLGQFADKLSAQLGAGAPAPEPSAAQKVAATAGGAVEEVAASAEQTPGNGAAAKATKKAATATKKAAASTTERVTATSTVPAKTPPAEKAAPAATDSAPAETAPAAADTAPATPAAAAPRAPSVPAAEATVPTTEPTTVPSRPRPVSEPEPIDLLEVAGGAAVARYAKPAAGLGLILLLIFLIARRRRD